jgi:hypothetical protein
MAENPFSSRYPSIIGKCQIQASGYGFRSARCYGIAVDSQGNMAADAAQIQGLQNSPELPFWASAGQSSDPLTSLGSIVHNLPINIVTGKSTVSSGKSTDFKPNPEMPHQASHSQN